MSMVSDTAPARSGAPVRWIPAVLGAAAVTAGLFLLMTWLIAEDIVRIEEPAGLEPMRISFDPEPIAIDEGRDPPERIDTEPPPPAPRIHTENAAPAPGPTVQPAPPRVEPVVELIGQGFTPAPPVDVRVPPAYPAREQGRGVEGDCTVRYDVTAAGQAVNLEVVRCDSSGFARATVDAVSQWRFAVSGGRASDEIVARGQTTTLQFRLD
ncbi:MAG: TonB family protein [Oceanicaulis sp.]